MAPHCIDDIIIDAWGNTGIIVAQCGMAGGLPNWLVLYDYGTHWFGQEICMMQKHLTVTGHNDPTLDPVITYEDVCIGTDLFRNKYIDGIWEGKELIELNSPDCDYIPPTPECEPIMLGDVNGDGIVDQADATLLMNWVSYPNERETTYKLACPESADVTGNGSVNIGDAILLRNHVNDPTNPDYAFKECVEPDPEPSMGAEIMVLIVLVAAIIWYLWRN